ncbi:MAG: hypothetical protein IT363_13050 [Methanoregulaceae archaeon]|nr:hypothetical protein [Methanoregulaceae archaeon]
MSEVLQGVDTFTQPSFSLGNRLRRLLWGVIWTLLFRRSPTPCFEWRNLLLRLFGAKIGRGVHIYSDAQIWAPWNLTMDEESALGRGVICYSMGPITLGKRVVVSQRAHLCAGTHDYEDPGMQLLTKPIQIGDRVWICAEAFIGPGVTIGEGAVIGARAVVTKDVPAWAVGAGNPFRVLKARVLGGTTQ